MMDQEQQQHQDAYTQRRKCRVCHGRLEPVLSLGRLVPSGFVQSTDPDPAAVPLELAMCGVCYLVQLTQTLSAEQLYGSTYWYRSGINESMRAELGDVVRQAVSLVGGLPKLVLDIGANDGTLLSFYPQHVYRVAYEPAANMQDPAGRYADEIHQACFPAENTIRAGSVDIATSIAMWYDIDDPIPALCEIDRLLAPDGVWVVQFQDLASMLQATGFDNVCFEHLTYYSLDSFETTLACFDLHVVKVERRAINGGSLRLYIRRRRFEQDASYAVTKAWEAGILGGVDPMDTLDSFAWRTNEVREHLQAAVHILNDKGLPLDLYAASTKSSTLLQYCGLDQQQIRQAVERSPEKWGLVTTGTRIPIVAEEVWRADPPPVTLVGAWQFVEQFQRREGAYLGGGGGFLVPLPRVRMIYQGKAEGVVA